MVTGMMVEPSGGLSASRIKDKAADPQQQTGAMAMQRLPEDALPIYLMRSNRGRLVGGGGVLPSSLLLSS